MTPELVFLIAGIIIGFVIASIVVRAQMKLRFKEAEKGIRQSSLDASRRSLTGKYLEKLVPFLNSNKHQPADMHFIGSPIDYVVFEGLHQDKVERVVFLEVKSGESQLSVREKSLRAAILDKKVAWEELRIPTREKTQK